MSNAAAAIRKGKLKAHTGEAKAGLRPYTVIMATRIATTQGQPEIGKQTLGTVQQLTIYPTPKLTMKRNEYTGQAGTIVISDCKLVGAFPPSLGNVSFPTPDSFIAALRKASYFLINGERFQYSGASLSGGSGNVSVDEYQSEWTLKLIKSAV